MPDHQTPSMPPQWKCGNEFAPYHPSASHVSPDYRDGWNHCYRAAQAVADERVRAALAEVADLKKQVHDLNWALGTEGYDKMHDPQDQADHEEAVRGTERFIQRMAEVAERQAELERKAARYDWLRSGVRTRQGVPTSGHRTISRDPLRGLMEFNFWCTAEELDAAIDATMAGKEGAK